MMYTRLGTRIWDWDPFLEMDANEKVLWLGLYTTAEAKRVIPGLFHGSISAIGDATARMQPSDVCKALDRMIERGWVEYDQRHRIVRLCELPDAGEYPSSPTILTSWWRRFQALPACPVRDAHVTTLRWILDKGAADSTKNRSKRPTPAHEEEWAKTFGTVQIPGPRRVQKLSDSDTGSEVQPGLFTSRAAPLVLPERSSSPDPGSDPENKDLRYLDTGACRYGGGEGVGEGSSFFGSEPDQSPAAARSLTARPALALVPPVQPYDEILVTIASASGRYKPAVRDGTHAGLVNVVRELESERVTSADLELVGRWIGKNALEAIPGDPASRLSVWVSAPGNVLGALARAAKHEREAAEASATLAELKKTLGY